MVSCYLQTDTPWMMQQILKQINITIIQMGRHPFDTVMDRVEMTAINMFVTKQAERLIQ